MNSDQPGPEAFSAFQDWISRHRHAMTEPFEQGLWDAARAAREAYARQHDVGPVTLTVSPELTDAEIDRIYELWGEVRDRINTGVGNPGRAEQGRHRG
jgi:hypothetical protein